MHYSVQFVGLACFVRGQGERLVMLPDGREPGDGIDPHFASIVVAKDSVKSAVGWENDDAAKRGIFALTPCSISIQEADRPGELDTALHDGRLPQLRALDPNFEIDPTGAQAIATIAVRRGKLTAYRVPRGTAVMSQLDVPYDGVITIKITPRDGSPQRSIELEPGTEIALANTARGGYAAASDHGAHFRIYEKLSAKPVTLSEPPEVAEVPATPSCHAIFTRAMAASLSAACSNTGCC
jgi:hypothetical protein